MNTYKIQMDMNNGMELVEEFDTTNIQDYYLEDLKKPFDGTIGIEVNENELREILNDGYTIEGLDVCLTNERIIFDNAGGVTLQLNSYAHYYDADRISQLCEDLKAWIETKDTSDWDGFDMDSLLLEPSDNDIRNGGYRIVEIGESIMELVESIKDINWGNSDEVLESLK